jgi:NAD-dependent dihydropyrimidine dehydrogenase PreA subunit
MLRALLGETHKKRKTLAASSVVSDPGRCVQCGICSYNCPINIDVRLYAMRGQPINESRCLTCGECVMRCPRGVLRFEQTLPLHVPEVVQTLLEKI